MSLSGLQARASRESADLWSPEPFETFNLDGFPDPIVCCGSVKKALSRIERMDDSDAPVLITGETGTGKELFARAVYLMSARRHRPFVPFNCAAIGRELAESHLFGHRRGSFTGALADNQGVIRAAEGGTLFLDEIGEMSLELQPKLLRFLQEGEIHPVGEARPIKVKVRVVAATNRDLTAEVAAGRFRADLLYRLNAFSIRLKPLREEREQINPLIAYYFDRQSQRTGKRELRLSAVVVESLCRYDWPGNVRELCNEIRRLVSDAVDGEVIGADRLSPEILEPSYLSKPPSAKLEVAIHQDITHAEAVAELERQLIVQSLVKHNGNLTHAAYGLKLTNKGLRDKMRRLGIERSLPVSPDR
jgi:transcriptional regulator with GAF, ATPase, and Fis domain